MIPLSTPLVDVISVVRNDLEGMRATAASVLRQDNPSFRWIVKDAASTDGTAEFVRELRDSRIHVVSERDAGIYDGMNIGASLGSAEYLIFMNGGDVFVTEDGISRLVRLVERSFSRWGYAASRVAENGQPVLAHLFHPFSASRLRLGMNSVPMQSTILRRDLYEELGGFETGSGIAADQQFFLKAASVAEPAVLWEILAERSTGGVSWGRPVRAFPLDMRQYRQSVGGPVGGNQASDLLATSAVIAWQGLARAVASGRTAVRA